MKAPYTERYVRCCERTAVSHRLLLDYAASDIKNADGTVVVKKGTLIEKVTTGNDGTAKFTADLPLGFSYDVKEVQAPEGYLRNADDVYTFTFSYTNDKEAKLTFKHTFKNERVTAKISLQKQDKETKKAVPQGDATLEKAVYGLYAVRILSIRMEQLV